VRWERKKTTRMRFMAVREQGRNQRACMRAFTPFFAGTTQLIKAQKVFNVHRDCGRGRANEALGALVSRVICNRSGRKINLGHTQKLSYYEWRVCIIVCAVLVCVLQGCYKVQIILKSGRLP
jgi:hypothetical protein